MFARLRDTLRTSGTCKTSGERGNADRQQSARASVAWVRLQHTSASNQTKPRIRRRFQRKRGAASAVYNSFLQRFTACACATVMLHSLPFISDNGGRAVYFLLPLSSRECLRRIPVVVASANVQRQHLPDIKRQPLSSGCVCVYRHHQSSRTWCYCKSMKCQCTADARCTSRRI